MKKDHYLYRVKVLILRFSSIGDIVLTTPVPRVIKKKWPQSVVHYGTKEIYASIVAPNPHIDKVIPLTGSLLDYIKVLKAEAYDVVIDLHNNIRTWTIKTLLQKKSYTFNKLNVRKWLLVRFNINLMPDQHVVDRYLNTVARLGIEDDGEGLSFYLQPGDEVNSDYFPTHFQQGYVAFSIGGKHGTKKMPAKRIAELCLLIGQPIVLLGGKEDQQTGEMVVSLVQTAVGQQQQPGQLPRILNGCGRFSIGKSAYIIKNAERVITHDTGMMHVAAAFQKHVICIWGSTVPAFGMYPYRTKYQLLECVDLACRPCSKIGFETCPKGHFKCMNDIDFSVITAQTGSGKNE